MSSTSVYNPKHINTVEADFDGIENELIWCDRKAFPYEQIKRQAECALWQQYPEKNWIAVRYPFAIGKDDYTKRLLFYVEHTMKSIPMNIDTLAEKMGVSKKISSFTIPLGATINMDGTSIMQGVAVVFTAQAFGIPLDMMDYLTVIGTATLASIGTAGVPSVGLITLTMVFNSVGLPIEGIALIMGIDRILDMTRTAVNITGDAVCTTIVASWNKAVDRDVYYRRKKGTDCVRRPRNNCTKKYK